MMGALSAPSARVLLCLAMTSNEKSCHCLLAFSIILSLRVVFSITADVEALLKFRNSLHNAALLNWDILTPPCSGNIPNWVGVLCWDGKIWGLQLEGIGLRGSVDVDSLAWMQDLRSLSLTNNEFNGPLPEIKKLSSFKALYLSNNQFSGEIPDDAFERMFSLKKLHLENNGFTGTIPSSLTMLPKLMELHLEGNQFGGKIPEFQQKELIIFNVSNNVLEGPVPEILSKLDKNSFTGNKNLCGKPLDACITAPSAESESSDSSPPSTEPESSPSSTTKTSQGSRDLPSSRIVIVAVVVVVLLITLCALIFILHCRKQSPQSIEAPPLNSKDKVRALDQNGSNHSHRGGGTKLSFVKDDREKFELQDLLKANANILGNGCFGSSYRASLSTGSVMVVKRFKQMNNASKDEFQEHMGRLGRLQNSNLLPIVAYCHRKEEKLLVTDFMVRGSLAVYLHGNHSHGQPSLDWPTRLKIVKGVARGLAYLNKELPGLIPAHGHLKSANVLLDQAFEPLLTDYGLVPVINQDKARELMVAYKSPEYLQHGQLTEKTDVWSLGILILEILTGENPANFSEGRAKHSDMADWVNNIGKNSTMEVLDRNLWAVKSSEGEMLKLLKIGLICCEEEVEKRLDIREVMELLEEVTTRNDEEEFYSSYASEGDMRSSRGMSDDFWFLPL